MMVTNTVQEKALNATDILYEYFFVLPVSWQHSICTLSSPVVPKGDSQTKKYLVTETGGQWARSTQSKKTTSQINSIEIRHSFLKRVPCQSCVIDVLMLFQPAAEKNLRSFNCDLLYTFENIHVLFFSFKARSNQGTVLHKKC